MTSTLLTGINPTGYLHLGNYVGAIKPFIDLASNYDRCYIFIADYHSLSKLDSAQLRKAYTDHLVAVYLSLKLPDNTIIFRQSDVPEIFELMWILHKFCTPSILARCHAYKAAIANNTNPSMCLFSYPLLMVADILALQATTVTIGLDQRQHLELSQDIVKSINHNYYADLTCPNYIFSEQSIVGVDGRKMSKSYNNTITLINTPQRLYREVMSIQTTSQGLYEPKNPATCNMFHLLKYFTSSETQQAIAESYERGIGWKEVKELLFYGLCEELAPIWDQYEETLLNPSRLHFILKQGAKEAREVASSVLNKLKPLLGV